MSKPKTFKDILEQEKKKAKPIAKWHVFITGKDIPHKDKSKYSRKEKHKADPQGNQPFLLLQSHNFHFREFVQKKGGAS